MKKQIDNQCKSLYKEKLRVMNYIARKLKKENRKFELVDEQKNLLKDLNEYLINIMKNLWKQPKIVVSILKKADPDNELKNYLAPLFVNNFYENILSSYFIEDNLMYVLTLLLKDEISNLKDVKQEENFLINTPCGCLLNELKLKTDIQAFFKNIILKSVEICENDYSSLKLNLEIAKLTEELKNKAKTNNLMKKGYQKSSMEDRSNDMDELVVRDKTKFQLDQAMFNQKYIPSLDKNALENIMKENQNNKKMYDYCNSKIKDCERNNDYYSNKQYLEKLYKSDKSSELLLQYQYYFNVAKSIIDSIIDNLIKNLHLLPYSVKCLCKIISSLIVKKFPTIYENEKNAFVAKFFFGKLLIPILNNPGIEAFIDSFIISKNTLSNLKVICDIIKKFTSGNFFVGSDDTADYTPFNWYFLEKMDKLFDIFSQITKVTLPSFIEKLINDELPSDYKYDYFKENPDEAINLRTICYNLEQAKALINIMGRAKEEIFKDRKLIGFKKTVEKLLLKDNQTMLNSLLEQEKNNKTRIYILMTELLTNEKYTKLLNIEQTTPNFSLKEIKSLTEEAMAQNDIIRVKNFFSSLLYNYKKLNKPDFDEGTTGNTISILKELNKYMKSSDFVVDGTIPSEWYVSSLLEYLEKIPKDLTENDCEKLYDEIKKNVDDSIKELDFEAISVITEKFKYIQKRKKYYLDSEKLLMDFKLNEETKKIIYEKPISVEIFFDIDENNLEENLEQELKIGDFEIIPSENKKKIKELDKKNIRRRSCDTIDSFTKKFPNLVRYQELQDADILIMQQRLKIPEKINQYFTLIKQHLEKAKTPGLELINEKIYDYVMGKVYDKVYPNEPYEKDNKIFQQSVRLAWTKLDNFTKLKKKMVFGNFLPGVIQLFRLVDSEKSPRKKLLNLSKIYDSIIFLLKFNGTGNEAGVDDQLPILNYALAKSQQLRMFSNGKYMELYIGEKKQKLEGSQLTQLISSCEFIANIKYSDLNEVTQKQFIEECNKATIENPN